MRNAVFTIRELLDEELDRRCYVSGINLKAEDLFDRNLVVPWIKALVGKSVSGKLASCIDNTPDERLSHTAAVYLLGMALRSRLNLHFDRMPRIISHCASDGFHFFWAMICLCHDLGYRFENESRTNKDIVRAMNTAKGCRELLGIEHNLFELDRAELIKLGIDPDSEDGKWILDSVELAKKYDRYRRKANCAPVPASVADHGICGALLLYDILRSEFAEIQRKRQMRRFDHPLRHDNNETTGNLDGAAKDSSPTRFIRCGLLIACTVARHNMWLASTPMDKALYQIYGLEELYADHPGVKIRADLPMEQMLFFLDFVDTIDPVKWFHLRNVERDAGKDQEYWKQHRTFALDRLSIRFSTPKYKSKSLKFELLAAPASPKEWGLFHIYYQRACKSLTGWLKIRKPRRGDKRVTFFLPFVPSEKNDWPCGITDHEVNSLLLYMGCSVPGRYGAFYSSSRAYQTFNLLMMRGSEGEKIRICLEKQQPNGIFIREWARSLQTMEDIFRAQCKYACEKPPVKDVLFRSDRKLNFDLMRSRNATYAMTSTSQGSYLPEFLVDKEGPHILSITMKERIPYFDYEGFFGEEYVYAYEREILLPPMISAASKWRTDFILPADRNGTAGRQVRWYDVTLGSFDPDSSWKEDKTTSDVKTDLDFLKTNAAAAANALDDLVRTCSWNTSPLSDPNYVYWGWKQAFRRVLARRMREIYLKEFCPTHPAA